MLMGISPRALSHYLAKYPSIDQARGRVVEDDPVEVEQLTVIPA